MGTLFERALDPDHRAQLGAHYTSEEDIKTLVEPVLMQPLRREWKEIKRELLPLAVGRVPSRGASLADARAKLKKFLKKLTSVTVLDPACGSGNFLYISLQLLLSLEKEVIAFATQLDLGRARPPGAPKRGSNAQSGRPIVSTGGCTPSRAPRCGSALSLYLGFLSPRRFQSTAYLRGFARPRCQTTSLLLSLAMTTTSSASFTLACMKSGV
jgi:hypothetical protein